MLTGRMRIRVPGILAPKRQRDALVRLHRQHELVGPYADRAVLLEREVGHRPQRHRDLGDLARQALAGAQVERHACPAPVVDLEAQRGVGLGMRVRRHALLLEIADDGLAAAVAGGVLGANAHLGQLVGCRRADRVEHLDLLVAHRVGGEGHRRLHAQQRQQLQHVILDQVAQRARVVVVAGAAADADVLGGRDLHVGDVVAIPQRLEHAVREAKREHVLDRLLAQVVVDAKNLALREHRQDLAVELAGLGSDVPNGFSITARTSTSSDRASPR